MNSPDEGISKRLQPGCTPCCVPLWEKHTREGMKKQIIRIVAAAILLAAAYFITGNAAMPLGAQLLVYMAPYLVVSYDTIGEAAEGVFRGNPLDENFLMLIATIGALLIGFLPGAEPEFAEGVIVMLFFKVGELFEECAVD